MDTTITRIGATVVAELRSAGYRESTIGNYEKTIRALTGYARGHGTDVYTSALGAKFASLTTSPRTGRFSAQRRFDFRRLVAVFDSYLETGRVDLSVRKRGGGGAQPTSSQFSTLNVSWEADMADRGLAAATREAYGRVARGYLCYLESSGTFDLDGADGGTVLGYLASLSPKWATTSLFWVVSNFRPFLTFTGRGDLVDAVNLAGARRSTRSCRCLVTAISGWWSLRVRRASCAPEMRPSLCWPSRRACGRVTSSTFDCPTLTGEGERSPSCSARRATR